MDRSSLSRAVRQQEIKELKEAPRGVCVIPAQKRPMNWWQCLAWLIHHPELLEWCLSSPDYAAWKRISRLLVTWICPKCPTSRDIFSELIAKIPIKRCDGDTAKPAPREAPKTARGLSIE